MAKLKVVYLSKWQLLFRRLDGDDNRSAVIDTFADYLESDSMEPFEIPGDCVLYGAVYGKKGFLDGTNVFTSPVTIVRRVNISAKDGVRNDLLCAETDDGEKYYLFTNEENRYMFLMLRDSMSGLLSNIESYYLDPYMRVKHPEYF